MKWFTAKGSQAARLRQRKHQLLRRFGIPENALPGSLSLTHRRCGKPTCHCATGKGHPMWSLTFMVDGNKRVERIPDDWVEEIRPLVEQGRDFKKAVAELFASNAQLLALWRQQQKQTISTVDVSWSCRLNAFEPGPESPGQPLRQQPGRAQKETLSPLRAHRSP